MRIFLLVISILAAICCAAQSSSFLNTDKVSELSGKIRNYQPNENNRFFTIRILPVHGIPPLITVPVNNDGTFTIQFIHPYTGDLHARYAGKYLYIYFIAGAKETIEIDEKSLLQSENIADAVSISGESGKIARLCMDLRYNLDKQQWKTQVNWEDTSKTDNEITDMYVQLMNEQLTWFETYTRQKEITNAAFQSWAKNDIMYSAAYMAASSMQDGTRGRKYTFPDIFHVIKKIPADNPQGISNSMYYAYISSLAHIMTFAYNLRPVYTDIRLKTGNNAIAYFPARIDSITTGSTRQLFYFYLFIANLNKADFYQQDFDKVVLDNQLKQAYQAARTERFGSFKEYNLLEKLKTYQADTLVKSRLIALFTAQKDNFVYLDFWGNWCGSCMMEIPFYGMFIDRFKGKKIKFFFMGVNTPEKESLKIKNKYRINARFITLNASEVDILRSILPIPSYPTHILLRPGSMVTNYGSEKITDGNTLHQRPIQKLESILANAQ